MSIVDQRESTRYGSPDRDPGQGRAGWLSRLRGIWLAAAFTGARSVVRPRRALRRTVDVVALSVGCWTHTWARTSALVGGRAVTALGWWSAAWSRGVAAAAAHLLHGAGHAQAGAARAARIVVDRWVPASAHFLILTATLLAFTLMITASFAPAASDYGDAVDVGLAMPDEAVLGPLGERSVVYAADGSVLAILHDEVDRRVVALDDLPDHVWQAVLAAEDRNFFEHPGYDVEAITRAAIANVQAGDVRQGGSTITQQLAKQNFTAGEQTFERKAVELTYAVALEEALDKHEILERYLNEVYFGGGTYGIAAAAEAFFGVDPVELEVADAAMLAGMIRAPARVNPRNHPERASARRGAVLAGMADEGYLDDDELAAAVATPLVVEPHREREVTEPYVLEAIKREFFADTVFGETWQERYEALFSGGLRIHTTIDPNLQQIAAEEIAAVFPSSSPTAALAAMDPVSGRVLAIESGADFAEDQFDLATQGRRQPGSAFKTIALAAALEQGVSLTDRFDGSSPVSIRFDPLAPPWQPTNYGGASFGTITLAEAHRSSVNTVFAQLVVQVGTARVEDMAERLGIDIDAALGPPTSRGPAALAIGGLDHGVTPLEMASAFATFGTGGERAAPYLIEEVLDARGAEVYTRSPSSERVLDARVARSVIASMQDVVTNGTGKAAQLPGWQVAGKTGTTQQNADGWFVGTVPPMATAVWAGHPTERVGVPGLVGGRAPAQLWHSFMARALADVEPSGFDF